MDDFQYWDEVFFTVLKWNGDVEDALRAANLAVRNRLQNQASDACAVGPVKER